MSSKQKNTFGDLNDTDYQLFCEYTGVSTRQAKDIFDQLHVKHPNGTINRLEFAQFFRDIDPEKCKLDQYTKFTDMIFRSFDNDHDDLLTVKELLIGFAVITKGDIDKRLSYAFSLYDVDGNDHLSKDEIKEGFKGMFIMGGVDGTDFCADVSAKNKVKKLDSDQDGKLSRKEFIEGVKKNKNLGDGLFFM